MTRAYIYGRMSRDTATLGEKLDRQVATAHELASHYGLTVPAENVVIEQESGSTLKNRPGLLRLMELMHAGLCSHVIVAFDDRLDRILDLREQADFQDALYAGAVTVISRDGCRTYDEDMDVIPVEFRALMARMEWRLCSRRLIEANRRKRAENQRWCGRAPFGYERDATAPGGYRTIPEEYKPLCEALNALLDGSSVRAIQTEWASKGIVSRSGKPFAHRTLWALLQNPFYAGYHAKTNKVVRGKGYRSLHPEEYELSTGKPGEWEHPITLEQWQKIRDRFNGRKGNGAYRNGLLTGILHCPNGSPMKANGQHAYVCSCPQRHYVRKPKWEALARRWMVHFNRWLPRDKLAEPTPEKPKPRRQLAEARRELTAKEDDVRSLAVDAERQTRLLGDALYESVLLKARNAWEQAKSRVEALQREVDTPTREDAYKALREFYEADPADVWHDATPDKRREMLASTIHSLTLVRPEGRGRHARSAVVEWQPWVIEGDLEPPPLKSEREERIVRT